eukprot:CAMPEP_0113318812 /NCGR_PEP_ID=MMETSP0010_2-20120614/13242_1 /TAXON_ID=216773 ORGANISM="Corethron hystrix, Strain 308" /NCGR_SAMPLE_ID=MMETSP0010_2 /ASSEMBLY_ACC=CAM_ASM_000155 /LENGTH=190 /DNA_ID=CAMNT_0000176211 /DNA_START=542 /DNA_END=1109 /DNA_ORIENTATION=+ /assembly_acc=CAM_ASM_000155
MDCDQTEAVGAGDGGMLVAAAVAVAVEEIAHEGVIWNKSLLSLLSFCGDEVRVSREGMLGGGVKGIGVMGSGTDSIGERIDATGPGIIRLIGGFGGLGVGAAKAAPPLFLSGNSGARLAVRAGLGGTALSFNVDGAQGVFFTKLQAALVLSLELSRVRREVWLDTFSSVSSSSLVSLTAGEAVPPLSFFS